MNTTTLIAHLTSNKEATVESLVFKKLLQTAIEDLDMSVSLFNILKTARINTLANILEYTDLEYGTFKGMTKVLSAELETLLTEISTAHQLTPPLTLGLMKK